MQVGIIFPRLIVNRVLSRNHPLPHSFVRRRNSMDHLCPFQSTTVSTSLTSPSSSTLIVENVSTPLRLYQLRPAYHSLYILFLITNLLPPPDAPHHRHRPLNLLLNDLNHSIFTHQVKIHKHASVYKIRESTSQRERCNLHTTGVLDHDMIIVMLLIYFAKDIDAV